jgi:hypothetical protein
MVKKLFEKCESPVAPRPFGIPLCQHVVVGHDGIEDLILPLMLNCHGAREIEIEVGSIEHDTRPEFLHLVTRGFLALCMIEFGMVQWKLEIFHVLKDGTNHIVHRGFHLFARINYSIIVALVILVFFAIKFDVVESARSGVELGKTAKMCQDNTHPTRVPTQALYHL